MMRTLDQIEETITSLAAYLVQAPANHDRYILREPDYSAQSAVASRKIRLTQHYTAAMLAYGFPPSAPELRNAVDWFATPFSQAQQDQMDELELTKLEGLLNLKPDDPGVAPRLKQLLSQRNGMFFHIIDRDERQGSRDPVFDTLWALKLIIYARQRGVLPRGLSEREISKILHDLIPQCHRDKDLALALRLDFDLDGKIDHPQALAALAERAAQYEHLWGVITAARSESLRPIISSMQRAALNPHIIAKQLDLFREVILNTCYVLENLSILGHLNADVEHEVQVSMDLWWNQFKGEKAPSVLRSLFPKEYDFLLILFRTMVAVNAYAGEPLAGQVWQRPLRAMAQSRFTSARRVQTRDLKKALRHWIDIQLPEGRVQPLKLGLSEASVYRIEPLLHNPTDYRRVNLLGNTSLVVKSGPIEQIDQERRRYAQLPKRTREYFVRIPERTAYINKKREAFVIMEDLNGFFTLYEHFEPKLKPEAARLGPSLAAFLIDVHRSALPNAHATLNHIREFYIVPLLRHLEFIVNGVSRMQSLLNGQIERFQELDNRVSHAMGTIMHHQRRMEGFPLALMHGDLHSRNIMIWWPRQDENIQQDNEPIFKLIDLESLHPSGDAAHDAGQLLIDLYLLQHSSRRNPSRQVVARLESLSKQIEQAYLAFAHEQQDATFAIRLELAQARALIRIAKGQTKRSEAYHKDSEFQRVSEELGDAIHLVELAAGHLDKVAKGLSRL